MGEQIQGFLQFIKNQKRFSFHTVRAYENDLQAFMQYIRLTYPFVQGFQDVHFKMLLAYLANLSKTLGKSSIARHMSTLKSFGKWCVKQGFMKVSPTEFIQGKRQKEKKLPHALSEQETFLLCETLAENPHELRDRAICELLYATGIRVAELCQLNLEDLDFHGNMVRILGKGDKERFVPFHETCREALLLWLQKRSQVYEQALFLGKSGKRMAEGVVRRMVKQRAKEAHIAGSVHPHQLRHTFASHLLENGADLKSIQTLLGHASISATQRYTQINLAHLMKVYDKSHPHAKK